MECNKIKCSKCFVTLKRLKEDGVCEYLVKIIDSDGKNEALCTTCLNGW